MAEALSLPSSTWSSYDIGANGDSDVLFLVRRIQLECAAATEACSPGRLWIARITAGAETRAFFNHGSSASIHAVRSSFMGSTFGDGCSMHHLGGPRRHRERHKCNVQQLSHIMTIARRPRSSPKASK